jgi:hypothetical protein
MLSFKVAAWLMAVALVATACATSTGVTSPPAEGADTTSATVANPGGINVTGSNTAPGDTTTTTVTPTGYTPIQLSTEEPAFDEVTVTTEDGLELHAKIYRGGQTAVLYTHHFETSGSGPQSGEVLAPFSWTLADAGYTVFLGDFRGHGESPGDRDPNDSKADIEAFYNYLVAEGYETIVAFSSWGSGAVVTNVDSLDDELELDGLALLFPSLARNGNDLITDLPGIASPVWVVHIDVGSTGGIPKRLSPHIPNLYEAFVYPRTPSGVTFTDVYGPEHVGRMVAFLEYIEGLG